LSYVNRRQRVKPTLTKIVLPKDYTENAAKRALYAGESDMTETKIGTVSHYYSHLHVAGVTITDGELRKGDTIRVKGHTSDFEQKAESMQIDHEPVEVAKPGDQIGLTVIEHAREHDTVYIVT
jgi:translation initiation factor IF-2